MTFSNTNIIKKSVFNKPFLLTADELLDIGQDINLVGYDSQLNLTSDDTNIVLKYGNPCSPKILNWVEPYNIAGTNYTLFYTEVNSGFNVGDRVFIINGAYDSDDLIATNKYKKGHDGYKVLYIDKCRVVLDIVFAGNGQLPSNGVTQSTDDFDKFIKVYTVTDSSEFLHVNRQITTQGDPVIRNVDFKFNAFHNNIIYTEVDYPATTGWGANLGLTGSPGFFIKNNAQQWVNVTTEFMSGSYSSFISSTYSNDKVIILNDSFTYGNTEFKEDLVYKWNGNNWEVNVKHENNNVPIMTKSNFRKGTFNGIWNGGLYGSNTERIIWGSTSSIWNSGTLLNTIWQRGILNSLWSQPQSYVAEFDNDGIPYQKSTNPDNDGYGYNFIINSELQNAVINNGNVSNSVLGTTNSIAIVEEHVIGNLTSTLIQQSFNYTLVNKAFFDNCGFNNANIENSIIKNSRVNNSRLFNVKSINTHYKSSLFKNSNYISDNVIKVLASDIVKYNDGTTTNFTHFVYKLYINKRSYQKFKFKDGFYLKGVKVSNTSMLNFFDKKFKLGPWKEYTDDYNTTTNTFYKKPTEYNAFISTPQENAYQFKVNTSQNQTGLFENDNGYSIDIFIKSTIPIDVDFSNAYILNSDFESGIFENSNWNSGSYINNNFDNNITTTSNEGGLYNLSIDIGTTNMFVGNIINNNSFTEVENDYLSPDSIVFLNAVDYDTRGRVISTSIVNGGTGYLSQTLMGTIGLTGSGLVVDVTADAIGAVLTYSIISPGTGYSAGVNICNTTSDGVGLECLIEVDGGMSGGSPLSFNIVNGGFGYDIGDTIYVMNNGTPGELSVTNVSLGSVTHATMSLPGIGYNIGDIVVLDSGDGNAQVTITGITGSLTRLPDAYKVSYGSTLTLTEVVPDGSIPILPTLLPDGVFSSYDANNRYGYLHATKFNKSKIVSGLFKRAYFKNSLIKNDSYDVSDKDFLNTELLRTLVISESIFSNNSNILSKASYINSYFVGGSDIWDTGIVYNSIWNGLTFNNGLIKESTWIDGIFNNGLFFNSKTFNYNISAFDYNSNNIQSFYKSGRTSVSGSPTFNNRLSWQNGTFSNGEFFKSDWENGIFNNGKFYYSKFYGGIINGGIIGDSSVSASDTTIYNAEINYTTVENAELITNPITTDNTPRFINWYNGIFNRGVFNTNTFNSAIWYNGIFNGGDFKGFAKWKDGTFNGGKFYSAYGYEDLITLGIESIDNYTWENGIFNGGEFGNGSVANLGQNSTWYNGEFNNGYFKGKLWNNGIFTFGEFIGSGATYSAIGGTASPTTNGGLYSDPANEFTLSFAPFSNNYFGLWRDGYVTNIKNRYIDREIYTDLRRSTDTNRNTTFAVLRDVLWQNGTFSHPNGTMQNSVWLNGVFENGTFDKSTFNPYVRRATNISQRQFNFADSIVWKNGTLKDSDFYISEWEGGNFISGTAVGMIWKNGITNYMNAYNVFWEDGIWRNGNWEGSYFDLDPDGQIRDDYARQVLFRGMSWSNSAACHVWNIFYRDSLSENVETISNADSVSWNFDNSINQPPTAPLVFEVGTLVNAIVITSVVNTSGDNYVIFFTTNFTPANIYSEVSTDGTTWSTPFLLSGITSPQNRIISLGGGAMYVRLSEVTGSTIYSNIFYYNPSEVVTMPSIQPVAFGRKEAQTTALSLDEALVFDGYSNTNSLPYAGIKIISTPSMGTITLQGGDITTTPYSIDLADIAFTAFEFWPTGSSGGGPFISYTTSFNYVVYDTNGNESDIVQMQIQFTAIPILTILPTTEMLSYRSNSGTNNVGTVCAMSTPQSCKVFMQTTAYIQTGDTIFNSNGTPFNGNNLYWNVRTAIVDIDDPSYPCLIDTNGNITVTFTCS